MNCLVSSFLGPQLSYRVRRTPPSLLDRLHAVDIPALILVVLWAAIIVMLFMAGYAGVVRGVTYLPRSARRLGGIAARIAGVAYLGMGIFLALIGVFGTLR